MREMYGCPLESEVDGGETGEGDGDAGGDGATGGDGANGGDGSSEGDQSWKLFDEADQQPVESVNLQDSLFY